MDTKRTAQKYRLQKWTKLIAERSASGLTIEAFYLECGIYRNVYFYWVKRVRQGARQTLPVAKHGITNKIRIFDYQPGQNVYCRKNLC